MPDGPLIAGEQLPSPVRIKWLVGMMFGVVSGLLAGWWLVT